MAYKYNQRITAEIISMEIPEDENCYDEEDDDEDGIPKVSSLKRNLMGEFGRPSVLEMPVPHEHMKVYLRIRPFCQQELKNNESKDCLTVESDRIVAVNPPKDSNSNKNMRGMVQTTKFTFSHIFNDNTSQKDFFSETMLGLVKDFIDGQNCLVFTYGVTSSGKTYTIQGNPKDAGILPRTLDVLFNSIQKRQLDGMQLKPKMFLDVVRLSSEQELVEKRIKENTLKLSSDNDMDVMSLLGPDASDMSTTTNTTASSESSTGMITCDNKESFEGNEMFADIEHRVREEGTVSVEEQGQVKFSVWISFAEIYNEQVYDVLEPVPKNSKRPCLKLGEDKNGSPYIRGLKFIQVTSADEAYKLLTIGQRNLQTACTRLNHSSSRSHCIFTIKMLRVLDKEAPSAARVSMFTLCDLAGSERQGKTLTTGDRLKEAGNINTSLLTLGRCLDALRYNQLHKDQQRKIPFRDSKLTRLFQNFFVGHGKAAMIVNVNQLASMFDETMQVFKFAAIASKVEVHQKPVFIKPKMPVAPAPALIPKTSISWATPSHNTSTQQIAENIPLPADDVDLDEEEVDVVERIYTQENIDELLGIIHELEVALQNEVENKWRMERQIRTEVCDEMSKQFAEIENNYSERLRLREQRAEELAERRMQIVLHADRAKRQLEMVTEDCDDEWVSSVLLHQEKIKVEQKDKTIKDLTMEIDTLKVKLLDKKCHKQLEEVTAKLTSFEERNKSLEQKLTEQTQQICTQKEQLKLNEEKMKTLEEELSHLQDQQINGHNKDNLIENLTQQLHQAREYIQEQEKEKNELNDMLTEAGETFEQKDQEINMLKELTREQEKKIEEQSEAIALLEQATASSKFAMETADLSLSKKEECVATLRQKLISLEGEIKESCNTAKFFEKQMVEKDQEVLQWKIKYEKDIQDHSKSQEALIHGFNAEISHLKSQIFHLKTQHYGVKSPTKSPDVKMKLFPMSPLTNTSISDVNTSSVSYSPTKDTAKHVNEQMKALQTELNRNCAMIKELEIALQDSRSTVEKLEERLKHQSEKLKEVEVNSLQQKCVENVICEQIMSNVLNSSSNNEKSLDSTGKELGNGTTEKLEAELIEKKMDIEKLNGKIKELELLMKDHFTTIKNLNESKTIVKNLNVQLDEKLQQNMKCNERNEVLEKNLKDLECLLAKKEIELECSNKRREELEMVNKEHLEMVNKSANDLQSKDSKLMILSPKSNEVQKHSNDESKMKELLRLEIVQKEKDIKDLKIKLSKLKSAFNMKDRSFNELLEKCFELEFRNNEKVLENQELHKNTDEYVTRLKQLEDEIKGKYSEIQKTGEELALISVQSQKYQQMIEEGKASICDLESAVVDKEFELCQKDSMIECKIDEILKLKADNAKLEQKLQKFEKLLNLQKACDIKVPEAEIQTTSTGCIQGKFGQEITAFSSDQKLRNLLDIEHENCELQNSNSSTHKEMKEKDCLLADKVKEVTKMQEENEKLIKNSQEAEIVIIDMQKSHLLKMQEFEQLLSKSKDKQRLLEEEVSSLQSILNKKNNAMQLNLQEIADLKSKNVCSHDRNIELTNELSMFQMKVCNFEEQLKRVEHEKEELQSKYAELNINVKSIDSERRIMQTNNLSLEDKIKSLEQSICNLESELSDIQVTKQELEDKIGSLQNDIKEKVKEHQDLQQCYNELEKNIRERSDSSKLSEALLEIAELKSTVHSHKTLHYKIKGELEETLLEHESCQGEIEKVRQQVKLLQEKEAVLKEKTEELDCAEKMLSEMRDTLKRKDEQHEELLNDLKNANKSNNMCRQENDQLREKVMLLQNTELESKQEYEKLVCAEKTIMELTDIIKKKDYQLEELQTDLQNANKQNEKWNKEMSAMEKTLIQLRENVKGKENQAIQLEEELNLSKASLNSIKEDIFRDICLDATSSSDQEEINKTIKLLKEQTSCEHLCGSDINCYVRKLKLDGILQNNCICELKKEIVRLTEVGTDKNLQSLKELKSQTEELQLENASLKYEIVETKDLKNINSELKCQFALQEKECVTLNDKVKVLECDLTKVRDECSILRQQLDLCNGVGDNEKHECQCDNAIFGRCEELQKLYEIEKHKNEEYQKMLTEAIVINPFSPQSGIRKMRIAKIETENALIEGKYKISSLESKVTELETKLNQLNNKQEALPLDEPLLQRKLQLVTSKLHNVEENNRSLIGEVTILQGIVEKLKADQCVKEVEHVSDESEICVHSSVSILQTEHNPIGSQFTQVEVTKMPDSEVGRNIDRQLQEYMEQCNTLKVEILKKESEIESKDRIIGDLKQQLHAEIESMKSFEKDKKSQEDTTVLKETLSELEKMLQEQDDIINRNETELLTCKSEYESVLDKYQALLDSKNISNTGHLEKPHCTVGVQTEYDLKQQICDLESKLTKMQEDYATLTSNSEANKAELAESEIQLKKALTEKDKLLAVIKENNHELRALECSLTEARKEIEDLKQHGGDKCSDIIIQDMQKCIKDINAKNKQLQCQNKELNFKVKAAEEKHNLLVEEKHAAEEKLQQFRVEKDKLVSSLDAVLQKKDKEIKQLKDMIQQFKEKDLIIKEELVQPDGPAHQQTLTEPSMMNPVKSSPVKVTCSSNIENVPVHIMAESPCSSRHGVQIARIPSCTKQDSSGVKPQKSRGRKRSSDSPENVLPPKRRSIDSFSAQSQSEDYSNHLQVDATPPVAAKTLRRTRRRNGSQLDVSKVEDVLNVKKRQSERVKKTSTHGLLKSFRESTMGKTSKRILDSITETFSTSKSPSKSPSKSQILSPLKESTSDNFNRLVTRNESKHIKAEISKECVNASALQFDENRTTGRGRGKHKLYKEDIYISEPFQMTGDFVQSSQDALKTTTRNLRSSRH